MSEFIPTAAPDVSPAGGKVLVYINSKRFGRVPMYVSPLLSPEEIAQTFNDHIAPQLAQETESKANAAALENANIPIPGTKTSIPGANLIGLGHGLDRWIVQPAKQLANWATDDTQAETQRQAQQQAGEQAFERLASQSRAAKVGDFAGQFLPAATAGMVVPALAPEFTAAMATRALPGIANAMVQGGAINAIPDPGPRGSRVQNAIEGAGFSGAFQAPFSIAGAIGAGPRNYLTPPQLAAVQRSETQIPGYNPTPYQRTGNPSLRIAERFQGFIPFSAGQMGERTAGNQAAISKKIASIIPDMPAGTTFPTVEELKKAQDATVRVFRQAEGSGAEVVLSPEAKASLAQIRDEAISANTPDTNTVRTLNKFIGDASATLRPELEQLGPAAQAEALRQLGVSAFMPASQAARRSSIWSTGAPIKSVQSVLSDLSQWSNSGVHEAGKAKAVIEDSLTQALNGVEPGLGDAHAAARRAYGAIEAVRAGVDPATGVVSMPKLAQELSGGRDVYGFGSSSNPLLEDIADVTRTVRGMPQPPPENSATAGNLAVGRRSGSQRRPPVVPVPCLGCMPPAFRSAATR